MNIGTNIGIYKLTAPDGSVYIGQSTNLKQRRMAYMSSQCKDMPKLYNSFLKYGAINHRFEVVLYLADKEPESLYRFEQYYIDLYRDNGFNILNSMNATRRQYKEGHIFKTKSIPKSIEHRNKISVSLAGKKKSPEHCRKNGLAKIGQYPKSAKRVINLETLTIYESARVAAEIYGYKHSTLKAMLNGQRKNKTNLVYENRYNNCCDE